MRFFHHVRSLGTWPRALLVGIVLAFGLSGVAHAAHQHDPAKASTAFHSVTCAYCVSFGSVAATPSHASYCVVVVPEFFAVSRETLAPAHRHAHAFAQPRAPPFS